MSYYPHFEYKTQNKNWNEERRLGRGNAKRRHGITYNTIEGSEGIGRKVKQQSKEKSEKNILLLSNTFGIKYTLKQTR